MVYSSEHPWLRCLDLSALWLNAVIFKLQMEHSQELFLNNFNEGEVKHSLMVRGSVDMFPSWFLS
jgi:hypothetical protein